MASEARRDHWPELDVMRAIAAAIMILNHVGVLHGAGTNLGACDGLVFLGTFAPVLFYFLTGLGHGVQSSVRPPGRFSRTLVKALILYAADALLWIRPGIWVGMDFLGFIALSLLMVEGLRRIRYSGQIASCLAVGVILVRYVADPRLRLRSAMPPAWWSPAYDLVAKVCLGSYPGFSYVLFPWIAYPLMGYALGRAASRHRDWIFGHRDLVAAMALVLSIPPGLVSAYMASRGMGLYRWGAMSFSYLMASCAFLALTIALTTFLSRHFLARWMTLSGERSFAVVPIHYFLRWVVDATLGPAITPIPYLRSSALVLAFSFGGSSIIPAATSALKRGSPGRLRAVKVAIIAGAAIALATVATARLEPAADLTVRCAAQLALCLLLSLPAARPAVPVGGAGA